MSFKYSKLAVAWLIVLVVSVGCSKETVSPETFGKIEGQILDSETENGIASVNITTSPATNSIITGNDGSFTIEEVSTGTYTVNADKKGYVSNSVSIQVREDKTATAQIYLDSEDENGQKSLEAEVTAWNERRVNNDNTGNDSTYADVEYEVTNTSDNIDINRYEVYFDVYTSGQTFSKEESDTMLAAGEKNIAHFSKYVQQTTIDSVVVSGTYTSN
jgi:hypothetical protein